MTSVDLVEECYIAASPELVASAIRNPDNWPVWWPDLRLGVFQDRGLKGVRWNVRGALVGSCEIWLDPHADGVVLHFYLRADPTQAGSPSEPAPPDPRRARRETQQRGREVRRLFWRLKDEIEGARRPGTAAVPAR